MEFVTFETALKLKEKGFNIPFYFYYRTDDKSLRHANITNPLVYCDKIDDEVVIAPTISQVLKWLRNTRKLFISPCVITDYQDDFHRDTTYWSFIIVNVESGDYIYREYERVIEKRYDSYEQAALAGIEYVLDNLI